MSEPLKPCPFCGATAEIKVSAYFHPPTCYVSGSIYCPKCRPITNNSETRKRNSVQQRVFWTDEEILKHVPEGLALHCGEYRFHPTTLKAAKAAAREKVIEMWQQRI